MRLYAFHFTEIFSSALFTEKMWRFYRDFFICYKTSKFYTKFTRKIATFRGHFKRSESETRTDIYRLFDRDYKANFQRL